MDVKVERISTATKIVRHKAVIQIEDILGNAGLSRGEIFYRCGGSPASHPVNTPLARMGRIEVEWEERVNLDE